MKSFLKLLTVQFKLFYREPIAFFFTLVFPTLLLVLFGIIYGNEPAFGTPFGYIDGSIAGLSGIIIGTVGLVSIPVATATQREQRVLRRLKATPMNPRTYLAADVVINYVIALVGLVGLIVIARLVFDLRFEGNWLAIWAAFTLAAIAFFSVGYFLASLAPTSRIATVVGQVLLFPMMFLSGATIPLQVMPDGVQQVAKWMPLTHVVGLLQDLWFGRGWNVTSLIVLAALILLGVTLSSRSFRWE
ncbi:MAG: ABC transporter permease [Anaerolineales bacterium]|nr:ABC transporter permease [Anaerolineales bacterium]MCB8961327.1 ABC transporter permease [Ardenticatenales bacterium]MCB0006962.1 ABC transporter permease [Anaerolineales bacterium]MCB0014624.1 ABC transporter permease [Anaerolineales bacterium]MCB0018944.1 ABC transporter permease [Anaerolineales bacterium]